MLSYWAQPANYLLALGLVAALAWLTYTNQRDGV